MRAGRAERAGLTAGVLCAALLWTAPGLAQEAERDARRAADVREEGAISETLTVRETTLHVRVRTPRRAVEELTRDRFRVLFGDRELPILAFEELDLSESKAERREEAGREEAESGAEAVAPAASAPGRSVLIVIDQLFTPRPYLEDTVKAVRKNLERFAESDRIAVMTLGSRAQIVHHFTTNREVVAAGLDLLEASFDADAASMRSRVAILRQLVESDTSYDARSAIGLRAALGISANRNVSFTALADPSLFGDRAEAKFSADDDDLFEIADISNENALAQTLQSINQSFADALRLVSDVPGPRYAMLFSGGVGAFRTILSVDGPGALQRPTGTSSSTLGSYQALSYVLQAHGWTVQSFDVSGVGERSQNFSMANSGPRQLQNSQQIAAVPQLALRGGLSDPSGDTLYFLADETGGDFYQQFNNVGSVLRESLEATSHHYRLVVRLEASDRELDRRRTLRVEVDDLPRKARVTHSLTAEWALPPNQRGKDAVESARRQLLTGLSEAALPADVAQLGVFLVPLDDTSRRAVVVLDANVGALSRRLQQRRGEYVLKVHALALQTEPRPGESSAFLDLFDVDAAWSSESTSPADRLVVTGDLVVPCSGAVIRLRFADPEAAEGVLREHLVPDTCGQGLTWATPLLGDEEDFAFAVEDGFSMTDETQNPFQQGGFSYIPDLRRMVERGEALTLLTYGSQVEHRLSNKAVPGLEASLAVEDSSELSESASLHTTRIEAEAGLYELTSPGGLGPGALVRVLDFAASEAAPPYPEEDPR